MWNSELEEDRGIRYKFNLAPVIVYNNNYVKVTGTVINKFNLIEEYTEEQFKSMDANIDKSSAGIATLVFANRCKKVCNGVISSMTHHHNMLSLNNDYRMLNASDAQYDISISGINQDECSSIELLLGGNVIATAVWIYDCYEFIDFTIDNVLFYDPWFNYVIKFNDYTGNNDNVIISTKQIFLDNRERKILFSEKLKKYAIYLPSSDKFMVHQIGQGSFDARHYNYYDTYNFIKNIKNKVTQIIEERSSQRQYSKITEADITVTIQ